MCPIFVDFRGKMARILLRVMALIAVAVTACPDDVAALPAFNRQTGQNCQACQAGGQFP
jgi:hypothetical protein